MTAKKGKSLIIFFSISLLCIILLVGFFIFRSRSKYEFVSPKRGSIIEAIYGLGKVKSKRKYDVKLGVLTQVKKVYVEEGEKVEKNKPLIRFSDNVLISAPFSGTVTGIMFTESDTVLPQSTVLTLQDLTDKYLEVALEQEGALRVKKEQNANVLFESVRGEKFAGQVSALFPKNDEFLAHIDVQGLGENILPGMTADISITVGEHKDVLMVPVTSLTNGHITRLRDDNKQKVQVKVGGIDGEWAEVIEGDIKESDSVLIKRKKAKN